MIQTQASLPQETLLLSSSSSFSLNLPDQDEEYEEGDSQDFYQDDDDEENEDSPLVWYHLPTKRPDPNQEKLRAESLTKRNQQIQEKKEQAKQNPLQSFKLLQSSANDHVSFKKINKLPKPSAQARLVCYIPDKNLIVILFHDGKTAKVYSTLNFKVVMVTKAQKEVKCLSYCKKLGRIIVGGVYEFLQLWSPKTFEVEAECLHVQSYQTILSVEYAAKSNVIIAKTTEQILIYNTGLRFMTHLQIPYCGGSWYSFPADIFSLSKNLLLAACYYATQKGLILFNIKTGNCVDCSGTAFVPITTSVEMTEKSPVNVFSCLGMFHCRPAAPWDDKYLYPLIQFTIDTKNEELVPVRSSDVSTHAFSKLHCIKNSKYFLAERFENYSSWKTCLLSIDKDKIETLHVLSGPSSITLKKINTYLMLKDGLSVVEINEVNEKHFVSVYKNVVHREDRKNTLEDSS